MLNPTSTSTWPQQGSPRSPQKCHLLDVSQRWAEDCGCFIIESPILIKLSLDFTISRFPVYYINLYTVVQCLKQPFYPSGGPGLTTSLDSRISTSKCCQPHWAKNAWSEAEAGCFCDPFWLTWLTSIITVACLVKMSSKFPALSFWTDFVCFSLWTFFKQKNRSEITIPTTPCFLRAGIVSGPRRLKGSVHLVLAWWTFCKEKAMKNSMVSGSHLFKCIFCVLP